MTYEESLEQDRRLTLLKALEGASAYTAAEFVLLRYCERFGHNVSSDRLRADLVWLKEQGLIKLQTPDDVYVATLTRRGLEVATGRAETPGVARPQPGM